MGFATKARGAVAAGAPLYFYLRAVVEHSSIVTGGCLRPARAVDA
jgi:hypothetical protein